MKKLLLHSICLLTFLLSTACHRNDIRTETFQIDQLRNQESVQLIAKALQTLEGVQKITPDFDNRELIVIFNGRLLYVKNIEYALVEAGFSLPHWPATAAARAKLPKELR